MQPKLQTILFFTFLICVQISITNSLNLRKSKIQSREQITQNTTIVPASVAALATATAMEPIPTNATLPATPPAPVAATLPATPPAPVAANATPTPPAPVAVKQNYTRHRDNRQSRHHKSNTKKLTNVKSFNKKDTFDQSSDNHRKQFNIHHEVPKNLTSLNNKVRDRFDTAHRRLDEINELKKENEERKIIRKLPSKPFGIEAIGILNFKLRHVSKHSQNFNIKSVSDFEYAYNKARYMKTATVTVNKRTYRIKQIGNNFWYGAIVGHGGIGLYSYKINGNYLLAVTHNQDMSLFSFATYFEHGGY